MGIKRIAAAAVTVATPLVYVAAAGVGVSAVLVVSNPSDGTICFDVAIADDVAAQLSEIIAPRVVIDGYATVEFTSIGFGDGQRLLVMPGTETLNVNLIGYLES